MASTTPPPVDAGAVDVCVSGQTFDIAYEAIGHPSLPVVVALGGISAHRHVVSHHLDAAPGWWQSLADVPDGPFDPRRFRIVSMNYLGHGHDTLQRVTTADQAHALRVVLDALGVESVFAIVGASYGAMVGQVFAAQHPHRVSRLVNISAAHRPHPYGVAVRTVQRNVLAALSVHGDAGKGMELARQVALLSYRCPADAARREDVFGQGRAADDPVTLEWLGTRAADVGKYFTPHSYALLSASIDSHDVAPEDIRARVASLAVVEDQLVAQEDIETFTQRVGGEASVTNFSSRYGHDAFLKEPRRMAEFVAAALR